MKKYILIKDGKLIATALSNKSNELDGEWLDAPDGFDETESDIELINGNVVVNNRKDIANRKLRIFDFIKGNQNPKKVDFTLLGLDAGMWDYERGARTERSYRDSAGNIVVRDMYLYEFADGGKNMRSVDDVTRLAEWFSLDGVVRLTKDVTPNFNKKKMKQLNRDLRQGRIDYLEASAEELRDMADMVPEPYKTQYNMIANSIDGLFNHYSDEVLKYISRGTMHFENAVINETDPDILAVFAIPSSPPSPKFPNGMNVKQSILYQLNGEKP